MAVYNINNIIGPDEYEMFIREQFDKTGRADLIKVDNLKWGHRAFNLTVAEIIDKFEINFEESIQIVAKFFENEMLIVNHKHHFTKNLYDYPIKEK